MWHVIAEHNWAPIWIFSAVYLRKHRKEFGAL